MGSQNHSQAEAETRWLCHICDFSSTTGSGYVCRHCYKIACAKHIVPTRVEVEGGGARLEMVCEECVTQEGDEA